MIRVALIFVMTNKIQNKHKTHEYRTIQVAASAKLEEVVAVAEIPTDARDYRLLLHLLRYMIQSIATSTCEAQVEILRKLRYLRARHCKTEE
jgi:hypothetical protein